ncbi:hypothetical protein Dimus_014083 [Dionaea muscipula]
MESWRREQSVFGRGFQDNQCWSWVSIRRWSTIGAPTLGLDSLLVELRGLRKRTRERTGPTGAINEDCSGVVRVEPPAPRVCFESSCLAAILDYLTIFLLHQLDIIF